MKKIVIALAAAGLLATAVTTQAATGEEVYQQTCKNCHDPAMAAAVKSPALGNKEDWAPRIAKGMDALYKSSLEGVAGTAMMARGTCPACTDDDLKAAVDYMVNASK